LLLRTPTRVIQCCSITVDSHYPAPRSNHVGREQRHIAHSRPDVQYAHAGNHYGSAEALLGVWPQQAAL